MTTNEIKKASATENTGSGTAPQPRSYRDPATGEWGMAPGARAASQAQLDAWHAEVVAAEGLPATLRGIFQRELVLILAALQCRHVGSGLLTARGRLAARYRTYLMLSDRATTLLKLLGLDEPAANGKAKPWAKLSRAEQELEAERVLAGLSSEEGG